MSLLNMTFSTKRCYCSQHFKTVRSLTGKLVLVSDLITDHKLDIVLLTKNLAGHIDILPGSSLLNFNFLMFFDLMADIVFVAANSVAAHPL